MYDTVPQSEQGIYMYCTCLYILFKNIKTTLINIGVVLCKYLSLGKKNHGNTLLL